MPPGAAPNQWLLEGWSVIIPAPLPLGWDDLSAGLSLIIPLYRLPFFPVSYPHDLPVFLNSPSKLPTLGSLSQGLSWEESQGEPNPKELRDQTDYTLSKRFLIPKCVPHPHVEPNTRCLIPAFSLMNGADVDIWRLFYYKLYDHHCH